MAATEFDRLETELPRDTAFVLMGMPERELKRWAATTGVEELSTVNEAVLGLLRKAPTAVIRPVYETLKYGGTQRAVTWFRSAPRPTRQTLRDAIREAPLAGLDLPPRTFARVWDDDTDEGLAVRLVTRRGASTIRNGFVFSEGAPYRFATLLWRNLGSAEVLEVHAEAGAVKGIIEDLLPALEIPTAHIEVLDIRDAACVVALKDELGGYIAKVESRDDREGSVDDRTARWARDGFSLDDARSAYMTSGDHLLPGLKRRVECEIDGHRLGITVSHNIFSVVLSPMSLANSRHVLEGAARVGQWVRFNDDDPSRGYGIPGRRSGQRP